ncbi:unnamed protein product [Pleuronectes platessa]|uniref:Uncharacterized protein n=1 Tax=Pleuronectes platessa TaxID=8262 RepID=A0A9N7UFV5_PLEPL|nr:unnamed protein product [Pleuronectes platessa]
MACSRGASTLRRQIIALARPELLGSVEVSLDTTPVSGRQTMIDRSCVPVQEQQILEPELGDEFILSCSWNDESTWTTPSLRSRSAEVAAACRATGPDPDLRRHRGKRDNEAVSSFAAFFSSSKYLRSDNRDELELRPVHASLLKSDPCSRPPRRRRLIGVAGGGSAAMRFRQKPTSHWSRVPEAAERPEDMEDMEDIEDMEDMEDMEDTEDMEDRL